MFCGLHLICWFQCIDDYIGVMDQIEIELKKVPSIAMKKTMAGIRECISGSKYSEM